MVVVVELVLRGYVFCIELKHSNNLIAEIFSFLLLATGIADLVDKLCGETIVTFYFWIYFSNHAFLKYSLLSKGFLFFVYLGGIGPDS
jgi:hypothetical protein